MRIDFERLSAVLPATELVEVLKNELASLRGDAEITRLRLESAHAEIARLRLTDAEREAIENAMDGYIAWMEDNVALDRPDVQADLYRLRGLLERFGGER